ncbi:DEAD/DEAH box helicase [Hydrogenothermus marinus]|uniref:DEAD/DEAH box helicase domain-containing protein n=1 Tax=Hydrogenothermus marinus TaxID=133270 RepID=A0A3M0B908_9AQUI|nr:DEAD/DEAH box helicase [Hydrogenothermus marinus]RMA93056.1 DEAD/DEAH box helicase domain-containing protein [Hydrogenothermus marinus]
MEILKYKNKVVYEKYLLPISPQFKDIKFENKHLENFLKEKKIKLYSHQAEAINLIKDNKNVVITTPTASGKSYIYIFSILEKLVKNPYSTSIILFPLKALARDQYGKILDLINEIGLDATVEVYDGDTPKEKRRQIKQNPPNFLITTPDMLNVGILPYHTTWSSFFENLDFVVLDEIHSYRGIIGSHICNIIKRLKRITAFYKSKKPIFITNSATIHNPEKFASKLIGEKVVEVSKSGAGSPPKVIQIYQNMRTLEVADLIAENIIKDISTIVFVDSRKESELLSLRVKDTLIKKGREDLIDKVSPYRSGYTPEERREIEFKAITRNILALISTSALEMGIDIGDLECCILVGYPGTLAQLWQRFGRAGRRNKKAYNILIPKRNALDQYFVKNPEELFQRQMEEPIINPYNKHILRKHIPVMANELPIKLQELTEEEKEVARQLFKEKKIRFYNNKLYASKQQPFSIRSAGQSYKIVETVKNKIIGDISEDILLYEAHPGAIYLHNGEKFAVEHIDQKEKTIYVVKTSVSYITEPLKESFIDVIEIEDSKNLGSIELFKGKVNVKTSVLGYTLRDLERDEKLNEIFFSEEEILTREFETEGFWFAMPESWEKYIINANFRYNIRLLKSFLLEKDKETPGFFVYKDLAFENLRLFIEKEDFDYLEIALKAINPFLNKLSEKDRNRFNDIVKRIRERRKSFIGALHGVEHSLIGIYPLFAMNDRWDIGGISTNFSPDTNKPTIYIYDGYEGGVGYAEVGFYRLKEMMESVYKNISKCKCSGGCPSCIFSPKCGNSNDYLDKTASIFLSHKILKSLY